MSSKEISTREMKDFYSEKERGCEYFVRCGVAHDAGGSGILEAPCTTRVEKGVTYKVIPIQAFKDGVFAVGEGEIGRVIDMDLGEERLRFARVIWKGFLQTYYQNPLEVGEGKSVNLEDAFSFLKAEPKRK